MILRELQQMQKKIVLRARTLERIVESYRFVTAYNAVTPEVREEVAQLVRKGKRKEINTWMKSVKSGDYGTYSLRQLRERGRELGIPYCSRLDKSSLLSEIVQHEQSRSKAQADSRVQKASREDEALLP